MAKKRPVAEVPMVVFEMFDEFLVELEKPDRSHIRLVKLDDQGLVEPVRKGNAFVMQPRVRIVATALDYKKPEILKLERKWDTGSGTVRIDVFRGRGSYSDPTGATTRDQITAALEARGFSVSQGEWTPESARDALAGLAIS